MENLIEIQGLCKHYKDFTLDHIDLTVPAGQIVGLIGENGAGKTTTLKALLGVIRPDGGAIRLLGGDITLRREEAFGPYFSLFPLEAPVDELTITGAKYPLKNHYRKPDDSLCVSNEFAEDEVKISFVYGKVILMETRD